MVFFKKEERNPFLGDDIEIFCDLQSAAIFHSGMLTGIFNTIRDANCDVISNEDNNMQVFIRTTSTNSFRATYRMSDGGDVKAINIITDGSHFQMMEDPSM